MPVIFAFSELYCFAVIFASQVIFAFGKLRLLVIRRGNNDWNFITRTGKGICKSNYILGERRTISRKRICLDRSTFARRNKHRSKLVRGAIRPKRGRFCF